MKPQFPTVQEQIDHWNKLERLEHERVMDIRAESPNERNETRELLVLVEQFRDYVGSTHHECKLVSDLNDTLLRIGGKTKGLHVASNPQESAPTTALTLDQTEATADWFDGLADTPYHLRDEGTVDGEGLSYAARNL